MLHLNLVGSIRVLVQEMDYGYGRNRLDGYGQRGKFIPYLYSSDRSDWLYFFGAVEQNRLLYDYGSKIG